MKNIRKNVKNLPKICKKPIKIHNEENDFVKVVPNLLKSEEKNIAIDSEIMKDIRN